jgi:putative peptidoglycan lipid II flippase
MALSIPITRLIYERGEFTASNTQMVALTLFYFSIGLIPYSMLTLLNRVFYAMKDTRTPLVVAAISIFFNFVFDFILIRYLSYAGLALSTSLVGIANFLALVFLLRRKIGRLGARQILNSVIRMFMATMLMSAGAYYLWYLLDQLLGRSTLSQVISLGSSILIAIGSYIALCYLFKLDELRQLVSFLKSKVSGVTIGSGES